jgi:hypothetical protein
MDIKRWGVLALALQGCGTVRPIFTEFPVPTERVASMNGLGNQSPENYEGHVVPVRHMYIYPTQTSHDPFPVWTPAPAKIYMVTRFGAQPGADHACAAYMVYLRSQKPGTNHYVYYFFDQLSVLSPELINALPAIPTDQQIAASNGHLFPIANNPWIHSRSTGSQGNCISQTDSGETNNGLDLALMMNLNPATPDGPWLQAIDVPAHFPVGSIIANSTASLVGALDFGYLDGDETIDTPNAVHYPTWKDEFERGISQLPPEERPANLPDWARTPDGHPGRYVAAHPFFEAYLNSPILGLDEHGVLVDPNGLAGKLGFTPAEAVGHNPVRDAGLAVWDIAGKLRGTWFSDSGLAEQARIGHVPDQLEQGAFCVLPSWLNHSKYAISYGGNLQTGSPTTIVTTPVETIQSRPYAALFQFHDEVPVKRYEGNMRSLPFSDPSQDPSDPGLLGTFWMNPDPALIGPGQLAIYLLKQSETLTSYVLAYMRDETNVLLRVEDGSAACTDPEGVDCMNAVIHLARQRSVRSHCSQDPSQYYLCPQVPSDLPGWVHYAR